MTMNCSQLADMLVCLPLVQECDQGRSGALRMSTPFRYPNGEHVDVFFNPDKELISDFYLSDFGQTANYLHNAQISIDTTARRRELVDDILRDSGVSLHGTQLRVRPITSESKEVSSAIFKLSQMCVRISDLAVHQRMRSSNPFRDDVEDFFEASELSYTPDVKFSAVFGKRELRMDFEVRSGSKISYVNILGSMNEAAAHSAANEIVVKLGDLERSGKVEMHRFVTIFNSASTAVRVEDIERLITLSSTVSYPDGSDTLLEILKGDASSIEASKEARV